MQCQCHSARRSRLGNRTRLAASTVSTPSCEEWEFVLGPMERTHLKIPSKAMFFAPLGGSGRPLQARNTDKQRTSANRTAPDIGLYGLDLTTCLQSRHRPARTGAADAGMAFTFNLQPGQRANALTDLASDVVGSI